MFKFGTDRIKLLTVDLWLLSIAFNLEYLPLKHGINMDFTKDTESIPEILELLSNNSMWTNTY